MGTFETPTVRQSHFANEMARLFIPGHNACQTAEYEATRKQYLRMEVLKMWQGSGVIPPPEHIVG